MIRTFSFIAISGLLAVLSFTAQAQQEYADLRAKITDSIGLSVDSIKPSPVPGLLQAMTNRGLFYISEDGTYLLHGKVFNLDKGLQNETEEALSVVRLQGLERFSDSVIEFKAQNEKYEVTVFTDTTCGYCRKLHSQIDSYNAKGITVRYLAFPRGGVSSDGFKSLVSVWCAENPQQAMTDAKAGQDISNKSCKNQVSAHYNFGQQVGVQGTPAIILGNGNMIPGYQPPAELIKILDDINS
ncbi:bifunctional protein-disulfide isomerase/oxidoreductase DsbC [Lacimicrobium alkaliphilum]|uniref:Thiol:disulfide interchange protein n=1 Tax=Lacimicrobium alkaliphilum TaxID=1526571 RepID=A0ABQ1QXH0_9ALTE|nr:bifunctional protein-disulfide isomerase/oxidoreductase DsbC [Lacimicrobium alkaliphilum]GGD50026.1 thiol:disulfide interchange protein DsbC [Lacimicrobium alkaliphilum]